MSSNVSLLVPVVNSEWFEPVGNENLFQAVVKKAGTCGEIGPIFAAVTPKTRQSCEEQIKKLSLPVTPIYLTESPTRSVISELRFYISCVQSVKTDWVAALRPMISTFFDADLFKFSLSKAAENQYLAVTSMPWPGWELVFFHRSLFPKLQEWENMLSPSADASLMLQHVLSSLNRQYGMLADIYYTHYAKNSGQPYDNNYPYFQICGESSLAAYRKITRVSGLPLSELTIEKVSTILRADDFLKGNCPDSVWVEISAVNDVPPIYSPLHHWRKPESYPPYMPPAVFERLLTLAGQDIAMCRQIHLSGVGEPLQNPAYLDIMKLVFERYQSRIIPRIHCYTDGRNLTEAVASEFVRGAVESVMISLDAVDEPHYKKVRPNGEFNTVKNNIERFLALKRAKPVKPVAINPAPIVAITTTLIAELEDHIDTFMAAYMTGSRWTKRYGKNITYDDLLEINRAYYKEGHMVEHLVIQGASTYAGQNPDRRMAVYTPLKRFPCRRLLNTLFVKTDGSIALCDRMFNIPSGKILGNIMDIHSIREIWDGLESSRRAQIEGRYADAYELCGKCEDWFIPVD